MQRVTREHGSVACGSVSAVTETSTNGSLMYLEPAFPGDCLVILVGELFSPGDQNPRVESLEAVSVVHLACPVPPNEAENLCFQM